MPPFEYKDGEIGLLYIAKNTWDIPFIFNGSAEYDRDVELCFSTPFSIGGQDCTYVLESSSDNVTWADCTHYNMDTGADEAYTISGNVASITLTDRTNSYYRFRIVGGTYDGYCSNAVYAQCPAVRCEARYWSYDYRSEIGETMEVAINWANIEDYDNTFFYDDADVSFSWYRVNPKTYEETPIDGATGSQYTLTKEDVGYKLFCLTSCKGNYYTLDMGGQPQIRNEAYISDFATDSFTLNLRCAVDALDKEALAINLITDEGYQEGEILSVTQDAENAAKFYVTYSAAQCAFDGISLRSNAESEWIIGRTLRHYEMTMFETEVSYICASETELSSQGLFVDGGIDAALVKGWAMANYRWFACSDAYGANAQEIQREDHGKGGAFFDITSDPVGKYIYAEAQPASAGQKLFHRYSNIVGPIRCAVIEDVTLEVYDSEIGDFAPVTKVHPDTYLYAMPNGDMCNVNYAWYRCSDSDGADATKIDVPSYTNGYCIAQEDVGYYIYAQIESDEDGIIIKNPRTACIEVVE